MVDVFDQHLEKLDFIGWIVLILLCLVVYLYDEKKSLEKSKEFMDEYTRKKHQLEVDKLHKEIEKLKK